MLKAPRKYVEVTDSGGQKTIVTFVNDCISKITCTPLEETIITAGHGQTSTQVFTIEKVSTDFPDSIFPSESELSGCKVQPNYY